MKITHCKLKKKVQKELLCFFVLEVTARSAADILGIHPNSAVLSYRNIRMVISHYLALAADEVFEGSIELDESYSGLNLNQYGVASPCRTICTVCVFVALS